MKMLLARRPYFLIYAFPEFQDISRFSRTSAHPLLPTAHSEVHLKSLCTLNFEIGVIITILFILASVSFWLLLIIELVARSVPAHLIVRLIERQMRDKWNFLHHPRLTSGGKDEIYYNATDWNLNTMKIIN